jgi:hypothetical protein
LHDPTGGHLLSFRAEILLVPESPGMASHGKAHVREHPPIS